MRVYTSITTDIETGQVLEEKSYEYSGPVAETKKGRETAQSAADIQKQAAASQQQIQQQQQALAAEEQRLAQENKAKKDAQVAASMPFIEGEESTAPGTLSPLAQSQYAEDVRNIGDVYGSGMRSGLRQLAYRGLSGQPSGMSASLINTANEQKGKQETSAFNNAQQQSYAQGLDALKNRLQIAAMYDPNSAYGLTGNSQAGASSSAAGQATTGSRLADTAQTMHSLGSGFGDVMQGIGTAADVATSFLPGGQVYKAASGFGKLMRPKSSAPTSTGGYDKYGSTMASGF